MNRGPQQHLGAAGPHRPAVHWILGALAGLAALVAVAVYWAAERQREQAQELLAQDAAEAAAGVDAELARTLVALKSLAASTVLQRGDLRGFHQLATRMVQDDRLWQNFQLIGPDGQQLVNARLPFGAPLAALNHPELPLRAVYEQAPVVSDVAMGAVAGRMLTAVYVPVLREGEPVGVVAAAIEPPAWQAVLRARLSPGVHAALLDRYSFIIANTYQGASGIRLMGAGPAQASADPASQAVPPTVPGQLTGDFERIAARTGEPLQVAHHRVDGSGWMVVTFMAADEAGWLHPDAWLYLASAALVLLGGAVAVRFGTRHRT